MFEFPEQLDKMLCRHRTIQMKIRLPTAAFGHEKAGRNAGLGREGFASTQFLCGENATPGLSKHEGPGLYGPGPSIVQTELEHTYRAITDRSTSTSAQSLWPLLRLRLATCVGGLEPYAGLFPIAMMIHVRCYTRQFNSHVSEARRLHNSSTALPFVGEL